MKRRIKLSKGNELKEILKYPFVPPILLAIGGGFIYLCGHLLITTYLLGEEFRFIDFFLDPLPLPYGHIIAAGSIINLLIIGFIVLVIYIVKYIEKRKWINVLVLILALLIFGFLVTNLYSSNEFESININGLIIVLSGLVMATIIIASIYAMNNGIIAISAIAYWIVFVTILLSKFSFNEEDLVFLIIPLLILIYIVCHSALLISLKLKVVFVKITIIALPYCLIFSGLITLNINRINILKNIPSIWILIFLTIIFLSLSILLYSKFEKQLNAFIKIKLVYHEALNLLKSIPLLLRTILISVSLILLLPSLIIVCGKILNEIDPQLKSQILIIDDEEIVGRYIGENNGLHYYIDKNGLSRTQAIIKVYPNFESENDFN
ncbi:hypothetical protein MKY91_03920 [Alkalicoccobacillus gibsonii]|uniref:DUF998 domain-containing protein n=1 Tax=Alkalicoccobacillus gibsonii TaxID=79881 RepID=A0ABU9VEQ3_9BACI